MMGDMSLRKWTFAVQVLQLWIITMCVNLYVLYYSVLLLKNKQTNVLKTNTVIKVNRRPKDAFSYRKTHNWVKTSLRNCSTSLATREEQMEATVHLLNDPLVSLYHHYNKKNWKEEILLLALSAWAWNGTEEQSSHHFCWEWQLTSWDAENEQGEKPAKFRLHKHSPIHCVLPFGFQHPLITI